MTKEQRQTTSRSDIGSSETLSDRTRGNMENLTLYGLALFIYQVYKNNTFKLQNLEGEEVFDGPVNGWFLKLYFI